MADTYVSINYINNRYVIRYTSPGGIPQELWTQSLYDAECEAARQAKKLGANTRVFSEITGTWQLLPREIPCVLADEQQETDQ